MYFYSEYKIYLLKENAHFFLVWWTRNCTENIGVTMCSWKHHQGAVVDYWSIICLFHCVVTKCTGGNVNSNTDKREKKAVINIIFIKVPRTTFKSVRQYFLCQEMKSMPLDYMFTFSNWWCTGTFTYLQVCDSYLSSTFFPSLSPLTSTKLESHQQYKSAAFNKHRLMAEVCWISLFIVYWLQAKRSYGTQPESVHILTHAGVTNDLL